MAKKRIVLVILHVPNTMQLHTFTCQTMLLSYLWEARLIESDF
jgi:hypothetical protein